MKITGEFLYRFCIITVKQLALYCSVKFADIVNTVCSQFRFQGNLKQEFDFKNAVKLGFYWFGGGKGDFHWFGGGKNALYRRNALYSTTKHSQPSKVTYSQPSKLTSLDREATERGNYRIGRM